MGDATASMAASFEKAVLDTEAQAISSTSASNKEISTEEDVVQYPGATRLTLMILGISFAVFTAALDENIVSTAIPKITDAFNSLDDVGWYGSAYLLPFAAFQLAWGKAYTLFPIKWSFISGVVIFEVGSVVAGAANSSNTLIAGRAISGFGAAGFVSGLFIMIAHAVPLRQRSLFTTLASIIFGVAAAAGPLLGGVLTSKASWRWCFFINVPFGVIAAVTVAYALKDNKISEPARDNSKLFVKKLRDFDWAGTITLVTSVSSFLVALQWGGSKYSWSNGRVIALLVASVILLLAFIGIQWRLGEFATVPGRMIKQRTILCCTVYVFCLSGAMEQLYYFLPIWFQAVQGDPPFQSGIQSLGLIISFVVGGVIAGLLVTWLGYYNPFMIAGSALFAIGAGLCTMLVPTSSKGMVIGLELISGIGIGFGLDQSQIAVQAVSTLDDVPIRTAVVMSAQILGSAIFLSVGNSILDESLIGLLHSKLPLVDATSVLTAGTTAFIDQLPSADHTTVLDLYSTAVTYVWYLGAALAATAFLFSLGIEWKSIKDE